VPIWERRIGGSVVCNQGTERGSCGLNGVYSLKEGWVISRVGQKKRGRGESQKSSLKNSLSS